MRRRVGIAAGILLAVTLAACGGGDSELSRSDFVGKADQICKQSSVEFARIQRVAPGSAEQAEKQVGALIDVESQALDELRGLDPPQGLRPVYDRYLKARERALGYLEQGRDAAADNDPQAYAAAKRKTSSEQAERLQLARRAGLRLCSLPTLTLGSG